MDTRRRTQWIALVGGALVCSSWLLVPAPQARAVPLLSGFGGLAGYGTDSLPRNDDLSSGAIDLTGAFPDGVRYFGTATFTEMYVNTNGNITFNGPLPTFTPNPFPVASQPMVAPYWADVDTRGLAGDDPRNVYWVIRPGQIIVTWHDVGYFAEHNDLQMDFQLILTNGTDCGLGDFDIEFRYNRCEWTTGDASGGTGGFGGTPAQAGFDAGNLIDYLMLPGSRTMSVLDLCTTSNVASEIPTPGLWRFIVRAGEVLCPDAGGLCDTGMPGACSAGIAQCVETGSTCIPAVTASDELCDGLDNDCDGEIDEGDDLCELPTVCAYGVCVPPCFEGGCPTGEVCVEAGVCVSVACMTIACPPGERCEGGTCIPVCDGVRCPHGQRCLGGTCIDPCGVITCGVDDVCEAGMCVHTCPCRRCGRDEICGADGRCVAVGCDLMTCDPGMYCEDFRCWDSCDGAICPPNSHCEVGDCVPGRPPVPTRPDAGMPDSGPIIRDSGPPPDSGFDAGPALDAGGTPPTAPDGCSCSLAARHDVPFAALLALPILMLGLQRRKRRSLRR